MCDKNSRLTYGLMTKIWAKKDSDFEFCNESSGSIKCVKFLNKPTDNETYKKLCSMHLVR